MMALPLQEKTIGVVKDYIDRGGGIVYLKHLLKDFKTAYKCELPFAEAGYPSVEDFLMNIEGILVSEDEEGIVYVESTERNNNSTNAEPSDDSQVDHSDDIAQLVVKVKNNLLLDCGEDRRVVTLQPTNVNNSSYKKSSSRAYSSLSNRSEEADGNKSQSSGSLPSLNTDVLHDTLPTLDYLSCYEYSRGDVPDTSYELPRDNYSLYENARISDSYRSNSYLSNVLQFQKESRENGCASISYELSQNENRIIESEQNLFGNMYTSGIQQPSTTPATDFFKSLSNFNEHSYPTDLLGLSASNENRLLKPAEKMYENSHSSVMPQASITPKTNFYKSSEKLYENIHPAHNSGMNDMFNLLEGTYDQDYNSPAAYTSNLAFNGENLNNYSNRPITDQPIGSVKNVFKPQYSTHIPDDLLQLASPPSKASKRPDIHQADPFSSILLPNNVSKFRDFHRTLSFQSNSNVNRPPTLPDKLYKTEQSNVFSMDGSGDWISKETNEHLFGFSERKDALTLLTDDEIIKRLVKVVNSQKQTGGIDSSTVELKYREMYFSTLPMRWLDLLEERAILYLEKLTGSTIIYPNRYFPAPPAIASLPAPRYPNIEYFWNVYITLYENIGCVWFRLKDEDFDKKYDILRREINRHYHCVCESIKNLSEVITGQLCSVNYKNYWYRGEVLEYELEARTVRCLLIDEGIINEFRQENLYPLHEKFTNTPMLILQGELASLGKWENCNYINCKIRRYLLNEPDVKIKISKFLSISKVSMQIFLTEDSQVLDLNFKMANLAKTELTVPVLYAGETYPVKILSAAENNTAQVQIVSPSLRVLGETLQKVSSTMKDEKNFELARIKSMFDLKLDKIYLARCEDGNWRRIVCRQFHVNNKVSALFIDFAEVKSIYFHDIFDTSVVPDAVSFIEPQAILVKMLDADALTLRFLKHIQSRQTDKILYFMEVLRLEEIPLVQLFAKLPNSEVSIPISHILKAAEFDIPPSYQLNS